MHSRGTNDNYEKFRPKLNRWSYCDTAWFMWYNPYERPILSPYKTIKGHFVPILISIPIEQQIKTVNIGANIEQLGSLIITCHKHEVQDFTTNHTCPDMGLKFLRSRSRTIRFSNFLYKDKESDKEDTD